MNRFRGPMAWCAVALWAAASGCGAKTDLDVEAPDAGLGVDAGPRARDAGADAAPPRRCDSDDACQDGSFCNGAERCDPSGRCVPAAAPACRSDGVACTEERCDEAFGCASIPRPERCPLSNRCDPIDGCLARILVHEPTRLNDILIDTLRLEEGPTLLSGLTDVAIALDGRFYGATNAGLFAIDVVSGALELVSDFPASTGSFNSLAIDDAGTMFGAGGRSVFTIDLDDGAVDIVATLPSGIASGDLAFLGTRGFLTVLSVDSVGDLLFEVYRDGREPREIGPVGFSCVWGLATFDDGLYGATCHGQLLAIDPDTGEGRLLATYPGREFYGAAAR